MIGTHETHIASLFLYIVSMLLFTVEITNVNKYIFGLFKYGIVYEEWEYFLYLMILLFVFVGATIRYTLMFFGQDVFPWWIQHSNASQSLMVSLASRFSNHIIWNCKILKKY